MPTSSERATVRVRKDQGAALALVLLFVVALSLWLAAATQLSQSTNSSVARNVASAAERAVKFNDAYKVALRGLTPNVACNGTDPDNQSDPCRVGTFVNDCATAADGWTTNGIEVQCRASSESGRIQPLASYLILGTGCDPAYTGADCVREVGNAGGLAVKAAASSGEAATQYWSKVPAYDPSSDPRLQLTGGIINAAGQWDGLNADSTVIIDSVPKVKPKLEYPLTCPSDPTGSADTWARFSTWGTTTPNDLCGTCPIFGTVSDSGTGTVCQPSSTEPYSVTMPGKVQTYVYSILNKIDPIPSGAAQILKGDDGITPGACSPAGSRAVTVQTSAGPRTARAVFINPGIVNSALMYQINNLISNTSCGDGSTKPAVIFNPGVYVFRSDSATTLAPGQYNSLIVMNKGNAATVIGGTPTGVAASATTAKLLGCTVAAGAQGVSMQFLSYTYLQVQGHIHLCPTFYSGSATPAAKQPVVAALGLSRSSIASMWQWKGAAGTHFFELSSGSNSGSTCLAQYRSSTGTSTVTKSAEVCADFQGQFFAPNGAALIDLKNSTYLSFASGAVLRAMAMRVNGAVAAGGAVLPSSATNGDRVVQLRFWDTALQRELGLVQLRIVDGFGAKLASGLGTLTWRTMW